MHVYATSLSSSCNGRRRSRRSKSKSVEGCAHHRQARVRPESGEHQEQQSELYDGRAESRRPRRASPLSPFRPARGVHSTEPTLDGMWPVKRWLARASLHTRHAAIGESWEREGRGDAGSICRCVCPPLGQHHSAPFCTTAFKTSRVVHRMQTPWCLFPREYFVPTEDRRSPQVTLHDFVKPKPFL